MTASDAAESRRRELLALLERLHRHKDAAYGDAWRKRGEVIAIFANLARKYDRLLVAFAEDRPAASEPLADTVADLCVYAGKYLTWLAEAHPDSFAAAGLPLAAPDASALRGSDALGAVFDALGSTNEPTAEPGTVEVAWADVRRSFSRLERGLMAQATLGSSEKELLSWSAKITLAAELTNQAAWLLTRLEEQDADLLAGMRTEVDRMDRGSTT